MDTFSVGGTRVTKVAELSLDGFTAGQLLPGLDPHAYDHHPEWFPPGTYDARSGHVPLSVHTWLVRHEGLTILIDTGAGNDKSRPTLMVLDQLRNPYLERLAAAGVRPEDVDYVLLTHIHADHVGWNTQLDDGRWMPTFPRAVTICSGLEWRHAAALAAGDEVSVEVIRTGAGLGEPVRPPAPGVFDDSMRPLEAMGRVRLIEFDDHDVLPGVRFLRAPGHSIDHAAIEIRSNGAVGLFGGDVVHHPVEIYRPDLVSMFCEFPDAVRRSRLKILEHAVATKAVFFSSHFPLSSAGYVNHVNQAYEWSFAATGAD